MGRSGGVVLQSTRDSNRRGKDQGFSKGHTHMYRTVPKLTLLIKEDEN